MAIKIKHVQTGAVVEVKNTGWTADGKMYVLAKNYPERWERKQHAFILTGKVLAEGAYKKYEMTFDDHNGEFEVLPNERQPRNSKTQTTAEPEPLPEPPAEVIVDEPTPQPAPAQVPGMAEMTNAFAALTPLFSGVQQNVMNAVMEQVQPLIEKLTKQAATQVKRIEVVTEQGEARKVDGVTCEAYEEMLQYVADGQPVYMYGAAGCGKSHTVEQIAQGLGLTLYSQSQVLFAYDVKGYGDAGGNYQHTPFFKAFTEGGLFFIDEMDASAPEALVVLNTAIANGHYDFPIIGNVKAHDKFRVIAAGNTAMTGADAEYTARFVQDASSRNRFAFFKMQYDRRVELPVMAGGDEVLMNFVEDLRNAISITNISLCVSYRQTKALANKNLTKFGKDKALLRNMFGGMESDEIRMLYNALANKDNEWAKAMRSII